MVSDDLHSRNLLYHSGSAEPGNNAILKWYKVQGEGIDRCKYSLRVVKSNAFFMQKLGIELYIHCSSCCV